MYNYSSIGKVSKKVERKYLEIIRKHRLNGKIKRYYLFSPYVRNVQTDNNKRFLKRIDTKRIVHSKNTMKTFPCVHKNPRFLGLK